MSKKPFSIPHHIVDVFDKEVDRMLKLGVSIDFRGLNDVTSYDRGPMVTIEDALGNSSNDIFFSELDLTKG